ncbi:MAG TPA: hypothetical protein VFZ61_08655, partial [Polyangiales bacterium]
MARLAHPTPASPLLLSRPRARSRLLIMALIGSCTVAELACSSQDEPESVAAAEAGTSTEDGSSAQHDAAMHSASDAASDSSNDAGEGPAPADGGHDARDADVQATRDASAQLDAG